MKTATASQAIKKLKDGGMNEAQIAVAIGVSPASIRRWEKTSHVPHPGNLERLRKLLEEKNAKQ